MEHNTIETEEIEFNGETIPAPTTTTTTTTEAPPEPPTTS